MKRVILLAIVFAACFWVQAYAEDILVNNKLCPISHEEVGSGGMTPHKVSFNGKSYNLCCAMCEGDFNKDPEKYAKLMDAEVAAEAAASSMKM